MNRKFKKGFLLASVPLFLIGCVERPNDDVTEEVIEDTVEISNIEVDINTGITEAVEYIDGAVVSILNLQRNNFQTWGSFYENPANEEEYLQAGSGSGAVYKISDDRAYIFTNNHVVEGSDAVEILFQDGRRVSATVEGSDLWTDLAVLSIDAAGVEKMVEFGDSDQLKVGEPAIAIGSPLGTEFASSVTSGIISGVGRTVPVDTTGDRQYDWEMTALQTDAAINPGNSGGPLINIAGQVIGINSMKISTETVEGMGFAIPSNDALDIINQLEKDGQVIRPHLGITMMDLAYISQTQQQEELKLSEDVTEGVVVTSVANGSAADKAGIQPADVIITFDGEPVNNSVQLRQLLYATDIGQNVEIEFYRAGEPKVTTLEMLAADYQNN